MQDFTSWDIKYYMQVDDPGTQAASSLEDKMSQVSYTQMNEWMKIKYICKNHKTHAMPLTADTA